jgi:plastocyanin
MKTHSFQTKLKISVLQKPTRLRIGSVAAICASLACFAIGEAGAAQKMVEIHDNFFSPQNLTIAPGDAVMWMQDGNSPHTTTSISGLWDSGIMQEGATFTLTFTNSGTFPYFCQVHGQAMSGSITVGTVSGTPQTAYLVNLTGQLLSTNATGSIAVTSMNNKGFIIDCANEKGLNPTTLALVYDTQADAIEVVSRSDGSLVCTVATFVGGVALGTSDGKRRERQGLVFWEDYDGPKGSMAGTELSKRDTSGNVVTFSFRGSIQIGIEAHDGEATRILKANFVTGRKFTPGM